MSSSAGHRQPKCHVLDFFYDDSNSCALTVLQNGVRFHVIADHKNFDQEDESGAAGRVSREYNRLVNTLRSKDEEEQAAAEGKKKSGSNGSNTSHDSGVDLSDTAKTAHTDLRKGGFQMDDVDVEQELQNWMVSPFAETFEELAPQSKKPEKPTVHEWYNGPTHFYDIKPDENGELAATELEDAKDLQERMQNLMPKIDIPKYIQQMDVPHFTVDDLKVTGEAADPDPYHPCTVEDKDGKTYFIKIVDKDQPQPTKRELKLLKRIEDIGLHKSINVPKVLGLVFTKDKSSKQIVGFLQTPISDPTPLTKMLDEDISQRKRDNWSKEVERVKELLHDNDIVFGDMKADNFLVDKDDKLWIIDFGGSYTEGWVDPDLMETEEGDDMGAEKIVNALHDPVNCTQDTRPDATPNKAGHEKSKRKFADKEDENSADDDVTEDEGVEKESKKRKIDADETPRYCICNEPEKGRMVACDNKECPKQWFHFECVGLKESPPEDKKWFCEDCKKQSELFVTK